jgi:nitrilase
VCNAIAEAAARGAELPVFPETFIPYYPYFSFVMPPVLAGKEHLRLYQQAVEIPGPVTARLAQSAKDAGIVLVVGVNERDGGTLYNTQLVFDADGSLVLKRRKITPSYHERMIWGQGDGSGFQTVSAAVGRLGVLACWEHYNPLARFALMEGREEIHCAQFPGSMVGQIFADQIAVTIRHHALESGALSSMRRAGSRTIRSLRLHRRESCRKRSEGDAIRSSSRQKAWRCVIRSPKAKE